MGGRGCTVSRFFTIWGMQSVTDRNSLSRKIFKDRKLLLDLITPKQHSLPINQWRAASLRQPENGLELEKQHPIESQPRAGLLK